MAPDRWVIVDDAESSISYSGSWFLESSGSQDNIGNFGPPYLETLHGTTTDGSVSFQFNGTAVEVWGTNNVTNFNTDPDPTLQCFVDDVSVGREAPFQFPENNWKLCQKAGLPDGLHNLRIEVKVQSPSNTFWLDQIRYIPSPNLSLDNKTILYDNMDPDVEFDAQWSSLGPTANMTRVGGSVAMVTFVGTSISWYAFIPTELPHDASKGSWSIDHGEDNMFLLKGLPAGSQGPTVYNQRYFTTPEFPAGLHRLAVTFHGSDQTTPLSLDYIYVKNGTFATLPPSSTSEASSTATSMPANGAASRAAPAGAIVGGVIGGLALLLCFAGILFFYKRRKRKHDSLAHTLLYQDGAHGLTPDAPSHMVQTGLHSRPLPSSSWTDSSSSPFAHRRPNLSGKLRREAEMSGYGTYHTSNQSHSQTTTGSGSPPWNPSTSHVDTQGDNQSTYNVPQTEDVPPQYTRD